MLLWDILHPHDLSMATDGNPESSFHSNWPMSPPQRSVGRPPTRKRRNFGIQYLRPLHVHGSISPTTPFHELYLSIKPSTRLNTPILTRIWPVQIQSPHSRKWQTRSLPNQSQTQSFPNHSQTQSRSRGSAICIHGFIRMSRRQSLMRSNRSGSIQGEENRSQQRVLDQRDVQVHMRQRRLPYPWLGQQDGANIDQGIS